MRARWFVLAVAAAGIVVGACGEDTDRLADPDVATTLSHGDPDQEADTAITTSHGPDEGWMVILLRHGVTKDEVAALESAINEAAPGVQSEFNPSWIDIEIAVGHEATATECFSWALPGLSVTYDPVGYGGHAVVYSI